MTAYIVTHVMTNPRYGWAELDAANAAHYAGKAQPELLAKAERIEAEAKRKVDEAFDEAERMGANPWDALNLISPSHYATIEWLNALKAYYNGDEGADCDHAPDETCRYCRAMAAVSNYTFEEDK